MDIATYLQFVVALLFVLALILIIAYGAKKFGLMARTTINSGRSQDKRLNIVEILPVDARRKLLLIRRDNVEHLVMLGTERDIVIERNITAAKNSYKAENS
ncbi:MAG: FliO/MopB family protein [Alphaproteobacteria bacterium]|nr:FliO/MopB family protein [Alphaproteobacteria bacterium]